VADVVKQGGRLAAAGSVIGLVCAALVGQLMRDSLYGVSAADPIVFAGVTLVVGLVALAAAYLPARRAARTDPIVALRCE
jgi:ABC-type antimicrobial peptide transport system permease subunit